MHTVNKRAKGTSRNEGVRFAKRIHPIHPTDGGNHARSVKNPNFFANNVPNWQRRKGKCRSHHTKTPHLQPSGAPNTLKQRVSHRIGKISIKVSEFFTDSTDDRLYAARRSKRASPPRRPSTTRCRRRTRRMRSPSERLAFDRGIAVAENVLDAHGGSRTAHRLAAEAREQGEHRL